VPDGPCKGEALLDASTRAGVPPPPAAQDHDVVTSLEEVVGNESGVTTRVHDLERLVKCRKRPRKVTPAVRAEGPPHQLKVLDRHRARTLEPALT